MTERYFRKVRQHAEYFESLVITVILALFVDKTFMSRRSRFLPKSMEAIFCRRPYARQLKYALGPRFYAGRGYFHFGRSIVVKSLSANYPITKLGENFVKRRIGLPGDHYSECRRQVFGIGNAR